MRIYLAGGESRHWLLEEKMRVFLAGTSPWRNEGIYDKQIKDEKPYTLESFYYADEDTQRLIPYYKDFLLDSGAFTFMMNSRTKVDWDKYVTEYGNYIKRNNIKNYFELDIDKIVGYERVLQFRKQLEKITGRRCIPVWHKSRGIEEFYKMCEEYDYAAIGGIVSKEIKPEQYGLLPVFIDQAHKRKCRLHGLGFTSLKHLPTCHFDSVDSTAWTTGNRFGFIYRFDGTTMQKVDCPGGKRLKDGRQVALNNYIEWIKFQKYAEKNL